MAFLLTVVLVIKAFLWTVVLVIEAFILIVDDLVTVDVETVVYLSIVGVVIFPFLMVAYQETILYLRTFSLVYLVFHLVNFDHEAQSNALFLPDVSNHAYLSVHDDHGDLDHYSSDESAHNHICYDVALHGV